MVIFDGFGKLIHNEFGSNQGLQRNDVLATESIRMKYLAENYSIPFLVSNLALRSKSMLGNTWFHCVNTRLALFKSEEKRILQVSKSASVRIMNIPFKISESGVSEDTTIPLEQMSQEFSHRIDEDFGVDLSDIFDSF